MIRYYRYVALKPDSTDQEKKSVSISLFDMMNPKIWMYLISFDVALVITSSALCEFTIATSPVKTHLEAISRH